MLVLNNFISKTQCKKKNAKFTQCLEKNFHLHYTWFFEKQRKNKE